MRIETLDLEFQGTPHVIAAFLVRGPAGPVLIEPGPGSTLETLLARLDEHDVRPDDVGDVLLTHIHLDHAGSAGFWARRGARVWVHAVGAPHIVDPTRLLASAGRIYGERMHELWGEMLPAPAERVVAVEDGGVLEVGGLRIVALDTPGHAWHHLVFRLADVAFTGDAAGIKLPHNRWVDLPAPPPEFDWPAWRTTLGRLRGLGVRTFYRTHFGAASDVEDELSRFAAVMQGAVERVHEMLQRGLERERMVDEFSAWMRARARELGTGEEDARAYELANPRSMSVDGIVRWWRKQGAPAADGPAGSAEKGKG
jgi:glyoxylase-like metal-dependent hydrolase (beta-lactamase superfamily II)